MQGSELQLALQAAVHSIIAHRPRAHSDSRGLRRGFSGVHAPQDPCNPLRASAAALGQPIDLRWMAGEWLAGAVGVPDTCGLGELHDLWLSMTLGGSLLHLSCNTVHRRTLGHLRMRPIDSPCSCMRR